MQGYVRADGRKGIRNRALVIYLGEGMRQMARDIVRPLRAAGVDLIGFGGTRPDRHVVTILQRLATHPNVGAVLVLDEGSDTMGDWLVNAVEASARPALLVNTCGGRRAALTSAHAWIAQAVEQLRKTPKVSLTCADLVIGTICGGSDSTSALSANPAIGLAYDRLLAADATAIFEETGELIGCDRLLAERAVTSHVAQAILSAMEKATRFFAQLGHGSFAPGNAEGGLTTIEEKSLGAYSKSGSMPIAGVLRPGETPIAKGLYLMDKIPDGPVRYGYSDATDNVGITEMIACGAHLVLFSTGRGSVVGSAIAPVIKICANPDTYRILSDDMDIDAGRVLEGMATLAELGEEIVELVLRVAGGEQPCSELLGHQEFLLTHKWFAERMSAES